MTSMTPLPIDPLLPQIAAQLARAPRLVLRAEPGAGKTTRVPAALLDAGLANGRQVLVLEPRRIAARAAAEFVARERRGSVGGEVGYRVRFEQRGGPRTRLWFLTEGILGRQLARDPFLEAAGVVVLDEFHERHLQGDVALAVIRELQESVRPDLKLVVMSATLDTERLSRYLGDCPVLTSTGRAHPVAVEYAREAAARPLPARVAAAARGLLENPGEGDVLVFLPGAAEIRRTAEALEPMAERFAVDVVPLHGDLPLEAQQRAIRRGPRRRVVLATNVAETALTVEGVTAVIDSGLARLARFDPRHGINSLRLAPISRAAAAQRAGRAGRTAPGRCLRLWTEAEQAHRRDFETPEILRLDLCSTVLELRAWGLRDPARFAWLDAPPESSLRRAEDLLLQLGAIAELGGPLTDLGGALLALPVHPRLGRILVEAQRRGCHRAGALMAALASERDILLEQRALAATPTSRWPAGPSDLLLRMQLFEEVERRGFGASTCSSLGIEARAARAVRRARLQLERLGRGGEPGDGGDDEALRRCVLAGFPDRVVRRRQPGSPRGLMVGGTGVVLSEASVVREEELFVAVDLEARAGQLAEARVHLASGIRREWLAEMPASVHQVHELVFDPQGERVVERMRTLFRDLTLDERVATAVDRGRAGEILAAAARRDPETAAAFGEAERSLVERVRFLQRWMPELEWPPEVSGLVADTVASLCAGRLSFAELRRADLGAALRGALTQRQRAALERQAPSRLALPRGRSAAVHYERDKPPWLAARIQDLFGLESSPRLAAGRVPLVVQLLAPSQRPVQITDDLQSFWRNTYAEVRKQLRGRYPKHDWPEDPLKR